jgi:hypothetical protein
MPVTRKNSWNISLRQKDVTHCRNSKSMSHYMNPPRTCALPVKVLVFTSLSTYVFFLELHNRIDQNQDCTSIYTTGEGWKHRVAFVPNPETVLFNTKSNDRAIIEFEIYKAVTCRHGSASLSCPALPSSQTGKSFCHMLPVSGVLQLKSRYVTMTFDFPSLKLWTDWPNFTKLLLIFVPYQFTPT